jgi:hypothetical protein
MPGRDRPFILLANPQDSKKHRDGFTDFRDNAPKHLRKTQMAL